MAEDSNEGRQLSRGLIISPGVSTFNDEGGDVAPSHPTGISVEAMLSYLSGR